MNTSITDERIRDAVIEQATEWYFLHRSGEMTRQEELAFTRWLRASHMNVREYLAVAKLADGLPEAVKVLTATTGSDELIERALRDLKGNVVPLVAEVEVPRKRRFGRFFGRSRFFALAGAVFVSMLLAAGSYFFLRTDSLFVVPHGEQRTVQLTDGSVMHVNGDSRVRVAYSKHERRVDIEKGQVLVEVAHDQSRPFRVHAGTTEVIAVGTQFDVYRRSASDVRVTVVEGKVDVVRREPEGSAVIERPTVAAPLPIRLSAGQQVQLGSQSDAPKVKPVDVDVHVETAWVRRELIFESQPLGDVAREFNRYIAVPIEIESAELRSIRVSGVFAAYDTESFLIFLKQFDVDVDEGPEVIRVHPRPVPTGLEPMTTHAPAQSIAN